MRCRIDVRHLFVRMHGWILRERDAVCGLSCGVLQYYRWYPIK
jgi:hypothetical protein